ncbi:S-DNA-T family DNA segregation ATPase FtsK/SpoIIIE [Catenuloplanes nepalensis]|uniref:S-DNA-T family DNA segregation ATPase FtsK/SpoIIIE n=1 Tax=Catenuloplanes nepalensis TaxID=587533 RepID=A0ABT9MRK9_9ACTN|nr:type VII secretion protein EccCa [Catenuloplanes nepalensis]MDP9794067.1 S-DNA-T family DNA segregation ATPase FtsK/SpoIIIE [Catenuloplanes nepalensis]
MRATESEIVLQAPPELPRAGGGGGTQQLLFMLPMTIGMGVMAFVYIGRSSGGGLIVFGVLFAIVIVGVLVMGLSRHGAAKRAQINDERRDYLRYLHGLRDRVRAAAGRQRAESTAALPAPETLPHLAGTPLMWSRRPGDATFGRVRAGLGPQRAAAALRAPQTAPLTDLDPVSSTSLRHFIRAYATVDGLPVAVSLRAFTRVTVSGDPAVARDLVRAMVAHLAVLHGPDDLRIAVCVAPDRAGEWAWAKWLPHAGHPSRSDAAGPSRMFAVDAAALGELLDADLAGRPPFQRGAGAPAGRAHVVIVADTTAYPLPGEGAAGVTVFDVTGTMSRDPLALELVVAASGRLGLGGERTTLVGVPDRLGPACAEAIARGLAPWHHAAPAGQSARTLAATLPDLLGLAEPWPRALPARTGRDRLRVPIGLAPDGTPVELDLKESAEGGMGPHGLVIGATGSGKSELLRTLVTGLVATHSSETLNLALVDFKGGATFTGMTGLPHVCAVITNLSAELSLVDRMGDALRGELVRRQELLRAAGNYASVRDYEAARAAGADLRPLPSLLVIIDEFSELLSSRPEFTELFVMIGRLGRSLGIHLLLASQRLEEGRLRGLDSHLSYRVGLRTFSAAESRTVLGVPDAYELPGEPGGGYLRADTTSLHRFKAAYVSGPLIGRSTGAVAAARPVRFGLDPVAAAAPPVRTVTHDVSTMDALLGRLAAHGPAAHRIWLPPLDESPSLGELLSFADGRAPGDPVSFADGGTLDVPVAIVDKPFEQRRDALRVDLSGGAGHCVVVGAPQSGKSTLLRTLVSALALTHTPRQVQFFVLDLGGGALAALDGLPHVSGVGTRQDPERCRRVVAEVTGLLAERETLFRAHGIDSAATFRSDPPPAPDGRDFGDVFLVVDGWAALRQEFEPLEEAVQTIAARGLGFGIHVVLSANRWMELRPAIRDMLGTQLELRLGDPSDSTVDRRAAAAVPEQPGRGLTRDGLHYLVALPRLDGDPAALVRHVAGAWNGPPAPPVRLLPRLVPADTLPADGGRPIPIGLAEQDLAPVRLDFDADPHLIVFGDNESGKTGLLRLICHGIMARYAEDEAAILVADYRRGLLEAVSGRHLLAYAGTEPALRSAIAETDRAMRGRLPGPDVTAEQLRRRDWWRGPELFVVVDDYDLIATQQSNPLAALTGLLPQSRDIGLHLIVARRTGGASRAMFEPVLQRLRDLGTPGVLLSGSRDEGALLGGVKTVPRPPGQGVHVSRRGGASVIQVAWHSGNDEGN